MVAVFYISGHGFGHASRQIEVMQALLAERPDTRILVRTAADMRLFETLRVNSAGAVAIEAVETDTGIAQIDSLRIDEEETARAAARFYARFDDRAAAEADRLRSANAAIAVGDIPPLAFAAAAQAGIPSVAVANFTWDWIYGVYDAFDRMAPLAIPTIRRAYALATTALRLPLHGGFEPMAAVVHDIPFIARQSTRNRGETRYLLGITDDRPVVLPSFGAYGAALPVDRLRASRQFTLLTIDDPLPHGLRYPDLVAAADVVVSKPGYGIVSECVANGTALLYTSRGRFIEYDLMVAGMPRVLRCRYLSQEDLRAGHWEAAVDALVAQPTPPERPAIDGARVAAREILRMASC